MACDGVSPEAERGQIGPHGPQRTLEAGASRLFRCREQLGPKALVSKSAGSSASLLFRSQVGLLNRDTLPSESAASSTSPQSRPVVRGSNHARMFSSTKRCR